MMDLVTFPPGRPSWLGKWKSQYTIGDLEASDAFDRYLLRMHQEGYTYAELASRHKAGVKAIWSRVRDARDIERRVARELADKRDVERVLREMVAQQQVQLAEQQAEIHDLASERRRRQEAESDLARLQGQFRVLQERVTRSEPPSRVELKIVS